MGSEPSPAAVSRRAAGSQETAESADTAGPRETAAELRRGGGAAWSGGLPPGDGGPGVAVPRGGR